MSTKKHDVPEALRTSLLAGYQKPKDLTGENGLLKQLTKLLVKKALDAELAEHLGHPKHEPVVNASGNTRNGKRRKTLKGEFGELPIEVPRDRHGTFEPKLIPKHQTRWSGFDDKVISLYARGMTVREIQSHLEEMYGTEVSPSLISSITDAVTDEVKAWQARLVARGFLEKHMPVFRPHRDNGRAFTSALAGRCRILPLIGQRIEGRVDAHTHLAAFFIGQGAVTVDAKGFAAQHLVSGATVPLGGGICLDAAASWMRLNPGGALGRQLAAYLPARKLLTFGQLFGCELRYDLISVLDSYCLALRR
jgi:hypothetical protein